MTHGRIINIVPARFFSANRQKLQIRPQNDTASIRAVVFDGAGTLFDIYSLAPVMALLAAFSSLGIHISPTQARGPMGIPKRKHIQQLLQENNIIAQWKNIYSTPPGHDAVTIVYQSFMREQKASLHHYAKPTPYAVEAIQGLQKIKLQVAFNSAYSREEVNICLQQLKHHYQLQFDHTVSNCDVANGRPAPDMLAYLQQRMGLLPNQILSIGDTIYDAKAAKAFGCHFFGVAGTSSLLNINSEAERHAMSGTEFKQRCDAASQELIQHGADLVLTDLSELPLMLANYNELLEINRFKTNRSPI